MPLLRLLEDLLQQQDVDMRRVDQLGLDFRRHLVGEIAQHVLDLLQGEGAVKQPEGQGRKTSYTFCFYLLAPGSNPDVGVVLRVGRRKPVPSTLS